MPNEARNEVSVTLMDTVYHTRPTFNAVARIEGALGEGVVSLGQKAFTQQLPVSSMAVILHHMAATDSGHKPPSIKDIGEFLVDEGIDDVVAPMAEFLLNSFRGTKRVRKAAAQGEGESGT